jgi:hypothetical protein
MILVLALQEHTYDKKWSSKDAKFIVHGMLMKMLVQYIN